MRVGLLLSLLFALSSGYLNQVPVEYDQLAAEWIIGPEYEGVTGMDIASGMHIKQN